MHRIAFSAAALGLALAPVLYAGPAHAQATRTWVSGVGDDVNPCSRTAPCKTFAGAISKTAAAGEIDCLDPGGFGAVTITKSITIDCGTFTGGILSAGTNGVVINAGVNDRVILRNLVINGVGSGINGIRFLAGLELHLDRVVIQQVTTLGIDVNKTALGFIYVKDSYFTGMPTAINLTTSSSYVIASIDRSYFNGMTTSGIVAASANAIANVSNSVFEGVGGSALLASASGAIMNAASNVLSNNGAGINASVSGAAIRATANAMFDNSTQFNVVAGATFLTGGDNKVVGGAAGSASTGNMTIK